MTGRRHAVRRYTAAENPLYRKRPQGTILGIIIALAGIAAAVVLVFMIVRAHSAKYAASQEISENYSEQDNMEE